MNGRLHKIARHAAIRGVEKHCAEQGGSCSRVSKDSVGLNNYVHSIYSVKLRLGETEDIKKNNDIYNLGNIDRLTRNTARDLRLIDIYRRKVERFINMNIYIYIYKGWLIMFHFPRLE